MAIRTLEAIPLYNEDLDTQEGLPAVRNLKRAITESDGVVIATPEYNHGVPGVLKNALDWVSRPAYASPFKEKPVLIASCSTASTGGVRAQYQLRETLASMLADIVPAREVVIGNVGAKLTGGRFTDEESLAHFERGLATLLERIGAKRLRNPRCS